MVKVKGEIETDKFVIEVMCGPKLDRSSRRMWFTICNGRKRRIGERLAHNMIGNGNAVEVRYRNVKTA